MKIEEIVKEKHHLYIFYCLQINYIYLTFNIHLIGYLSKSFHLFFSQNLNT